LLLLAFQRSLRVLAAHGGARLHLGALTDPQEGYPADAVLQKHPEAARAAPPGRQLIMASTIHGAPAALVQPEQLGPPSRTPRVDCLKPSSCFYGRDPRQNAASQDLIFAAGKTIDPFAVQRT